MPEPQDRLRHVLAHVPELREQARGCQPELLPSDSNDVWRMERTVLRVCWRGETSRLLKDAAISAALPLELRHPRVLDSGDAGGLAWVLTEVVEGRNLASYWQSLSQDAQRLAIHRSADALRVLHDWAPPPSVAEQLSVHEPSLASDALTIVEGCVNPLPVSVARVIVDEVGRRAGADKSLISDLRGALDALSPHDPYAVGDARVVVHGDLSIANVLWREGGDISVLDFEWARWGSRDMDLPSFSDLPGPDLAEQFRWIYESYPELFAYPQLTERLWLYEIIFTLRGLLAWWPSRPQLERLRRLVVRPPEHVVELARARD